MKDHAARKMVVAFLILTFAFCTPFYFLIVSAGSINVAGGLFVAAIMWCPGVAALLTRLFFQRNFRGIGWQWGRTRYQAAGYFLPAIACLVVYGFVWVTGLGDVAPERLTAGPADMLGFVDAGPWPLVVMVAATIGVLEGLIFATGEELGWRGLLVPELAKTNGYTTASLITGLVWAVFHFPLLLFADYTSSAPRWYSAIFFTVGIVGGSFVVSWLRLRSGSVWTAAIMHSSHNLFTALFNQLTIEAETTEYITTEFGAGLAITYAVCGAWCWTHRADVGCARTDPP